MSLRATVLLTAFVFAVFCGATAIAGTADAYHIHAGDTLTVTVTEDPTFATTSKVLDDGTLGLPLVGRVPLAGLAIDEAEKKLASLLSAYIHDPQVTVNVVDVGTAAVLVLGDVKNPGRYELPAGSRFTDALAAAGGLGPVDGALPEARVGSAGGPVQYVSLQGVLRQGDLQDDLVVNNGDVVYIPSPIDIHVTVLGSVDHPGQLPLHYGDTISMAIAMAGDSSTAHADLSHIYLTRVLPNDVKHTYEINLYQALQGHSEKYDVPLQEGDVVYVPQEKENGGVLWGALLVLRGLLLGY